MRIGFVVQTLMNDIKKKLGHSRKDISENTGLSVYALNKLYKEDAWLGENHPQYKAFQKAYQVELNSYLAYMRVREEQEVQLGVMPC